MSKYNEALDDTRGRIAFYHRLLKAEEFDNRDTLEKFVREVIELVALEEMDPRRIDGDTMEEIQGY